MQEHACPKVDLLSCPLKKCDRQVKATFGALPCACKCKGLVMMGEMKDADYEKDKEGSCKLAWDVYKCVMKDNDVCTDLQSIFNEADIAKTCPKPTDPPASSNEAS